MSIKGNKDAVSKIPEDFPGFFLIIEIFSNLSEEL